MNQTYRVVWNASRGLWQAVSELAASAGKSSGKRRQLRVALVTGLVALTLNSVASPAHADSQGGAGYDDTSWGTGGTGGNGNGNAGTAGTSGAPGGSGGSTGLFAPSSTIVAIGNISGTDGAAGASGMDYTATNSQGLMYGDGGGGGGGGAGITVGSAGSTLTVDASTSVTGGNGGSGGISLGGLWAGGGGGGGGDGVDVTASTGTTINNQGSITGGNGGGASYGGSAGAGGAGISGANLSITNSGTIAGGLSGNGSTRGDSIYFTGGVNTLTLQTGSTLSGAVELGTGGVSATISAANAGLTVGNNIALDDGNAALTLSSVNNLNVGGIISGAGSVTLTGTGTLTLTGANTYSGATTINDGTLALSGSGSIAQSSGVTDNGTFDISNTTTGATIQNLSGTGSVKVGGQTLTLANASGTFNGTFTGTGKLVKEGSGSFVIDGTSSSFSGTTEVADGLLEVGDIDNPQAVLGGSVEVDADATLRGHGTILGDVTNDGTVAPGGSIGTLTVGGNYTQASNATLSIEVGPTSASQLKVIGSATLNGVLAITYDPGTYTATQYTIVSAATGVTGEFSSTTSTLASGANLGTLQSSVTYGANTVELVLADPVVVAPTGTSIYTALGTAAVMNAQGTTAALLDRVGRASAATAGAAEGWINATGAQTKVGGSSGAPGFQANQYGFLAGLEQKLGDTTLGIAGGYTHTDLDEQTTGDSGITDTLRAALYASRWLGPVGVSGTVGYGVHFLSQKRPFEGVGTAEGDHIGQEFTTAAQASLPLTLGSFVLTPRAGLRYAYFHANGFDESGAGGQDLQVGRDNVHSLQPYVEVTLDKAFGDPLKPVNVQLRVGYAHEVLDAGRAVSVTSQDGTLFTASGTSLPRGYLTTGVSVGMQPTKNLKVSLGYDALINTTHASAQAGTLKVDYMF
jgi:fibronectin-binding autotransporter adhesin